MNNDQMVLKAQQMASGNFLTREYPDNCSDMKSDDQVDFVINYCHVYLECLTAGQIIRLVNAASVQLLPLLLLQDAVLEIALGENAYGYSNVEIVEKLEKLIEARNE